MQRRQVTKAVEFAAIAAFAALSVATRSFAQQTVTYGAEPSTTVNVNDALGQAASGTTIPLSAYTIEGVGVRGGGSYHGVLVGGDPFSPTPQPATIHAVVIPLIIEILTPSGTIKKFDPTEPNHCDGGYSAEYRFRHSPLVEPSPLTFNGVSVGNRQYIDGFMKAEFWRLNGNLPGYSNPISWSFSSAFTLPPFPPGFGIVQGAGCNELGIISKSLFSEFLLGFLIPSAQAQGIISPTKFAFFLMKNMWVSKVTPITGKSIQKGYHNFVGSPPQTYAVADFDTTGRAGVPQDTSISSHEIGEWMNDPLTTNPTPAWAYPINTKCQSNFEVGDPLGGTYMPIINLNGYKYHVQELAYFWWFFNARSFPSFGIGGFSGNGKFDGPAKSPCPPGGSY